MEAHGLWGIAAIVAAATAGACAGCSAERIWKRKSAAANALAPSKRERLMLVAQKGVGPLKPLATKILKAPAAARVANEGSLLLEERGVSTDPTALLSLVLALSVSIGLISALLTLSAVCGIAMACLFAVASVVGVRNRFERRSVTMREQIPDALRCMGTCFRSGLSLSQTLQQTSKECKGALGRVFGVAAKRLQMGASTDEALSIMRQGDQVPELSFVAVALDVQHQSGGSIAPVLETARESVISELDLMRSLRVQTAQAKLSASIVTIMPFVLVALFSLISPGFLEPFFSSLAGVGLLSVALVMQLSGVLAVRHMLRIDAG